jgi:outer membrane protein OmpA-like peptidoglycan-associated protein
VDPIHFATGRDEIPAVDRGVVDSVAETLKTFPRYYLLIRGHVSTEGDKQANLDLARRRAENVRKALLTNDEYAVADGRMRVELVDAKPGEGKAKSVSFTLLEAP